MWRAARSADGIDQPLLAAEAGELVKHAHDEDSDDELVKAPPPAPAPPLARRGPLRRCIGFFNSQGGATVCSIWLCLILKVVQQARLTGASAALVRSKAFPHA